LLEWRLRPSSNLASYCLTNQASDLAVSHWFEGCSLTFYIKFVNNDKSLLTIITILIRARFIIKIYFVVTMLKVFKNGTKTMLKNCFDDSYITVEKMQTLNKPINFMKIKFLLLDLLLGSINKKVKIDKYSYQFLKFLLKQHKKIFLNLLQKNPTKISKTNE